MKSFQELHEEINHLAELTALQPDRDVVDVLVHGISKGGAGLPCDNQLFTTWFYGAPDCTYISDWIYFLLELAGDGETYSMPELCKMMRFWFVQPSHFSDYCGLNTQYRLTREIDAMADRLTREEFTALLSSFRAYIANLNVWISHYWPWGDGFAFQRKDSTYYEQALALYRQ